MQNGNPSPSNLVGANPALLAAIQRRSGGQSPLNQVGRGTPGVVNSAPLPAPVPGNPSATAGVDNGSTSKMPMNPNDAESKIIVKALSNRLTQLGKPMGTPQAPAPTSVTSISAPPQGGF